MAHCDKPFMARRFFILKEFKHPVSFCKMHKNPEVGLWLMADAVRDVPGADDCAAKSWLANLKYFSSTSTLESPRGSARQRVVWRSGTPRHIFSLALVPATGATTSSHTLAYGLSCTSSSTLMRKTSLFLIPGENWTPTLSRALQRITFGFS